MKFKASLTLIAETAPPVDPKAVLLEKVTFSKVLCEGFIFEMESNWIAPDYFA